MGMILVIIGYGWAILGVGNIILFPNWATASEGMVTALFAFNVLLFILPGLVTGGMGTMMRR